MDTRIVALLSGLAVILPLVVVASVHVRRARKIYRERTPKQDPPPILKLLGALVLGVAWVISQMSPLSSSWQPILGHVALEYALLVTYSANSHILTGRPHYLRRSILTRIVTVLALSSVWLGYLSRGNVAHPFSGHPFTPTLQYCLYYSLVNGTVFLLFSLILNLYWKSFRQSNDFTYQARRGIGLVSITFGLAASVLAEVSIILSIVYGAAYHSLLTIAFYSLLPWVTLFPVAQAIPQPIVARVVQPLERHRAKRREGLLRYLHTKMLQIVPGEQLSSESFDLVDALTEISGARRIIWTQGLHTESITAHEEARHLFHLLQEKKVIETAGKHNPPQTATSDVVRHNIAVAKHLRELEARISTTRRLIYDTER